MPSSWKNRDEPFEGAPGFSIQKQTKQGRTRLRLDMPGLEGLHVPAGFLFDLAELLDDYCDAVEDGHVHLPYQEKG